MASTATLNKYDYEKFCRAPLARTIHRCAQKSLPEIGLFPSVLIDGCMYDTPILKREGDNPIFCKIGEGACGSKSDFDLKRNETYGFDVTVKAPVRAEDCQSNEQIQLLGQDRFNYEKEDQIRNIFSQTVHQLYKGHSHDSKGFGGLPEAVVYKIDALSKEWNGLKDFTDGDLTTAGIDPDCLYSVYLLRVADSATIESQGLKWIWGNNATIREGDRRIQEVVDSEKSTKTNEDCSYEAYVQHLRGSIGFASTCDTDVIEIVNVPGKRLDGFFLENVLTSASIVYNDANKFNRILTNKLAHQAMWFNIQNQNSGDRNCCIVAPTEDGGFARKMPNFFDGVDSTPIIISDCMPATGKQTPEIVSQKDLLKETTTLNK